MRDQLFRCGPEKPFTPSSTGVMRAHNTGQRVIDLHCHVHVSAADELLKEGFQPQAEPMIAYANTETRETNQAQMRSLHLKLTTAAERLRDMDRLGIDVQALSPSPFQFFYWADPDRGNAAARLVNDGIAAMVAAAPERFVGLGTLPMQAPNLAITELERVAGLGFRGIEIATSVQGEELSAPRFRPFFARAEELGMLLFLHPNGFSEGRRLADHYLINIIGNPLDATIAVSHLIFDGVLDELPGLKICVAHGGGYLPAYAGRMDHAYAVRADCRRCIHAAPTSYLRRLYFDTVVFDPAQLEFLARQYGADHITLGTDYPYDMGETDPVGLLERVAGLGDAEKAAILGGNAARLLGLKAPAAPDSDWSKP